jgi:hypothetical protein
MVTAVSEAAESYVKRQQYRMEGANSEPPCIFVCCPINETTNVNKDNAEVS